MQMEYEAALLSSVEVNPGVKSFRFSLHPDFVFAAGQFFRVKLSDNMVKHFSFSNSPTEGGYMEFTTRMTGSEYKNVLDKLKAGDKVLVSGPYGNFTYDPVLSKIAFLSGGIGITPIRSICRYVTDRGMKSDIFLFYGSEQENGILFKKDFEEMAKRNKGLRVVHVLNNPTSQWNGYKGFITRDIILREMPDFRERTFYICGSPGMVGAMTSMLGELGVGKDRIRLESFTGY